MLPVYLTVLLPCVPCFCGGQGEDARCAMLLYRAKRTEWERELKGKKLKVT